MSIWLDCDPGIDDAFAIIMSALHPDFKLIGLSTTAGNVGIEKTTQNALDILYTIHREDIPVYRGSPTTSTDKKPVDAEYFHGGNGLGGARFTRSPFKAITENSFEKICEKILSWPEKVTFVVTGPQTNLCLLLRNFPKIKENLEKIVLMGGAVGEGNITPAA